MPDTRYPKPLNIAHRGARSLAPENTIAAARAALETGADLWELDTTMTADGELVLLHDDSLERTSNASQVYPDRGPWNVSDFTLEELRELDFGSWFNQTDPLLQISAGNITPEMQQGYIGEKIPTLREALLFTRDHNWRVNVEIKDATGTPGDQDIVEKVVSLIKELEMEDRVLISSFNHSYISRVKAAAPHVAAAPLVEKPVTDPVELVRSLGAEQFNPGFFTIQPENIEMLRKAGIGVNVWTVNDSALMHDLIQNGASGIITDFPQVLHAILQDKKENS